MNILLTGGTGYIGSHTATVLAQQGHRVVLLDNLSNSSETVVGQLARILGAAPAFVQGDVRDAALLERVLRDHAIQAVIHFAGLKAVGESVEKPLEYFSNNVQGTVCLLQAMRAGIPCLGSRDDAAADVIVDGETGLLVPRQDPDAISGAVVRLLTDETMRRRLGVAGRRRFDSLFTYPRFRARLAGILARAFPAAIKER